MDIEILQPTATIFDGEFWDEAREKWVKYKLLPFATKTSESSVTLKILFGKDQSPIVESLLVKLKDEIIKTTRVVQELDNCWYTITFVKPYGLYLFGYHQAKTNAYEILSRSDQ